MTNYMPKHAKPINTRTMSNIFDFQDSSNIVENTTINENIIEEKDNNILIISEKKQKVFLPYKKSEVNAYLNEYPEQYSSFEDVVNKEFILPINYYVRNFAISRFREAYSLIRDREGKSIMDAIKYSMNLMFKRELNPAIIAACKTEEQLENYLNCLDNKQLDKFNDFEILYEINPL